MKELPKVYEPQQVEGRIYRMWMDHDCFKATPDPDKKPFSIVMPPPNVTGQLHMGHAMDATLQDILTRFKRMQGYEALWLPGTDHAGIATQIKVEEELRTYAAKRRQRLAVERAKIDVKAREAFARALFGERHPYGVSSHEEAYDSLTRDDVAGFYRRFYTAENCFVVCSGRIGDHELKAVAELAGRIPRGAAEAPPAFPAPETTHTAFVEYPGAVQSSLRIGRLLFPRTHPDFLGMQVVATALGGYFGSRLMQNLREEHGYTYGVVSAMVNFEREGYFAIAAQVGADVTQEALREIYAEIERLGAEPMPEAELELVKNMMTGEMMRILDGPFGIADVTIENILCGCDNTVIGSNIRRIREMTPAGVQQLARKYLRREDLVTVVAGAEKPAGM